MTAPLPWSLETCPEAGLRHTPIPSGYLDRAFDAERRIAAGQRQVQCPKCGLWATWLLPTGEPAPGSGPGPS